MKQRLIYILTTITLLLTGCVNERVENVDMYTYNMILRFNPSVVNTDDQENKMETVQLIMVRNGEVIYDKRYTDGEVQQFGFGYTINSQVRLPLGDYDVHVLCNLDKVENSNHATNFPAGIAVPVPGMIYSGTEDITIPMYGKTTCKVEADTPLSIVFDEQNPLNRLMSKITLDFKTDGDFAGMKVTSISINNFCEKVKLGTTQGHEAPSATTSLVCTMPTDAPLILPAVGPATFYIPETYVTDPNHPTQPYIEVNAFINNDKTGGEDLKIKYKLKIETNTPNAQDKSYVRNTQYDITATVKSYGEAEDMFIKVNVLPWNLVSLNDEVGKFVAYDKVTDAANQSIADGSNLDDMGTTIKVVCNTNIGGWYTVTRDRKGSVVHRSSPTASVSVPTLQTVDVTIPALEYLTQNYTVNIYHPTFVMESVGPVKSLNFSQRGGFIPNSVLIAAGWPAYRLPKTGLQIAKRGNVLPAESSKADDPEIPWSTIPGVVGIKDAKLATGKGNYAQLSALDSDMYPIGLICRNLGPEWYVPSKEELTFIYNNKSTFGVSYSFVAINDYYYWSATEVTEGYSWGVGIVSGYTAHCLKTINKRVRCVREL